MLKIVLKELIQFKMYSKKEEWTMMITLLSAFFGSNYFLSLYVQNCTLFTILSTLSLYIIGASIITVMEYKKQKLI